MLPMLGFPQASVSTRKGNKKLAIYDLKITAEWQAQGEDDEQPVGGVPRPLPPPVSSSSSSSRAQCLAEVLPGWLQPRMHHLSAQAVTLALHLTGDSTRTVHVM
jgi:hypothetical protein